MEDTTFNLVEHWKRHSPRPDEQIPFGSIMSALNTPYSVVEFKEDAVGRWGVSVPLSTVSMWPDICIQFRLKGQRKVAEFSFAGVVAQADSTGSGNLVPDGEDAPEGLDMRKRWAKKIENVRLTQYVVFML